MFRLTREVRFGISRDGGVVVGKASNSYAGNPPLSASRPRAVAGVAIVTAVFFLLLPPLGYLIGFTSYLFVLTLWLHRRNPAACLLVSVIFAIASYLLFVKALGVALPKGILYF